MADITTPLSMVNTDPELDTVISPLSPSSTPPLTETTDPASFLVNNLAVSVLMAISPTERSDVPGSLPEPLLIVTGKQ